MSSPPVPPMPENLSAVFLDRDGVINEKMPEGRYVASEDEFRILPGVPEAIARLNKANIRVLVVSNQRGVALGITPHQTVIELHHSLEERLRLYGARVDGIYFCPHDKQSCSCRKPLPGLYQQAVRDFPDIRPGNCVMVGDSLSDIEFGRRLGMLTIWVDGAPELRKPGWEDAAGLATRSCRSLSEAVDILLQRR